MIDLKCKTRFLLFFENKTVKKRNFLLEGNETSQSIYGRMTPTRAVQTFLDSKKQSLPIADEVWNSLKGFRNWNEPELIGLRNASSYFPEIYFEKGMDEEIERLLAIFKKRNVPHKF